MRAITDRWTRLPAVVRWPVGLLAVALVYGVAYALVAAALGLDSHDDDMTIRLLLTLTAPLFFALGVLQQRRRLGGRGQLRLYRRAYRSGAVPAGANADKWRPQVRRQARFFREGRRVVLIVWALFGALAVLGVIVAVAAQHDSIGTGSVTFVVIFVAVWALVVWGLDRLWRWRQRQFERLERALDEERPAEPVS
jgi:NADH:ubiquinone oxidoreductase subunit 3 (subunit A)